jgi:HKD family nuclease
MISGKKNKKGYGKLLEAWEPPAHAGDPIGCLATSFTFSATFFEEECLSRFLGLESDPNEDGPLFLIEREEKLASVVCAAALVDQHHCRGGRSLRWDLLPARLKRGILHAKISLLCWNQHVRVIISSANLTEQGYRTNQEVFGVLDFMENGFLPASLLNEVIDFLKECLGLLGSAADNRNPAIKRCAGLLEIAARMTRNWNLPEKVKTAKSPVVDLIFVGPGRPSAFEGLRKVWRDGSPPDSAVVMSPFFDEDIPNRPASEIWNTVNRRGKAKVVYQVLAEEIPGKEEFLIHAPETLKTSKPANRRTAEVHFSKIKEIEKTEQGKELIRPIHLKSLWLESDKHVLYMVGSSNFTGAGMGLGPGVNLEANIAFSVNRARNKKFYRILEAARIQVNILKDNEKWKWLGSPAGAEDAEADEVVLPAAFVSAIYKLSQEGQRAVEVNILGNPPKGWIISHEARIIYDEVQWKEKGRPNLIILKWEEDRPPSGFEISWTEAAKPAWLPVNVLNMNSLPPPEDLMDLTLEALIDILTSARPLHQVIRRWLKRREKKGPTEPGPLINPHDRVDTSSFLLQRTRRVSFALNALRNRLERPTSTKETLDWRLRGPIGVSALAKAISKEAKSDQERAFILTELAMELSRVRPKEMPGSLPRYLVKKRVAEIIKELREMIARYPITDNEKLRHYIQSVLGEICQ